MNAAKLYPDNLFSALSVSESFCLEQEENAQYS